MNKIKMLLLLCILCTVCSIVNAQAPPPPPPSPGSLDVSIEHLNPIGFSNVDFSCMHTAWWLEQGAYQVVYTSSKLVYQNGVLTWTPEVLEFTGTDWSNPPYNENNPKSELALFTVENDQDMQALKIKVYLRKWTVIGNTSGFLDTCLECTWQQSRYI